MIEFKSLVQLVCIIFVGSLIGMGLGMLIVYVYLAITEICEAIGSWLCPMPPAVGSIGVRRTYVVMLPTEEEPESPDDP